MVSEQSDGLEERKELNKESKTVEAYRYVIKNKIEHQMQDM